MKKVEEPTEAIISDNDVISFTDKVKKEIKYLESNLDKGELITFNPLVRELGMLKLMGDQLKMKPKDKDGKYDKDNIQEFVDLKKNVRTYRAGVKRSAKKLKDPRIAENKAINSLQNVFIDEADAVYDNAEKEFAEYVEWEEGEKIRRQAAKDAETQKQIDDANAEATAQKEKMKRTMSYNNLMYEHMEDKINPFINNITEINIAALRKRRKDIEDLDFDAYLFGQSTDGMDENDFQKVRDRFDSERQKTIDSFDAYIKKTELEEEKRLSDAVAKKEPVNNIMAASSAIDTKIPPMIPPPPGSVPDISFVNEGMSDFDFIKEIKYRYDLLSYTVDTRIRKNPDSSTSVKKLKELFINLK